MGLWIQTLFEKVLSPPNHTPTLPKKVLGSIGGNLTNQNKKGFDRDAAKATDLLACSWDKWRNLKPAIYPLVNIQKTMERSTIFHGKIHYNW